MTYVVAELSKIQEMGFKKYFVAAALIAASAGVSAAPSLLQPERLRVEHMENPGVVDTHVPRMSWVNAPSSASVRNAGQRAYRLVVASSNDKLAKGEYDVWDSGKVMSDRNYLVDYDGAMLEDGQDYYWRVMVWDNNGVPSKWSETAQWGMGLTDPSRWEARWIGAPWQGEASKKAIDPKKGVRDYPAPLLRRDFNVGDKLVKAKAFVTGLGYFELRVNGEKVGDDLLVPNFTNYTKRHDLDKYGIVIDDDFAGYRVMYLAYDVTDMLKKGGNTIGAILGNGFFDSTCGWVSPFGTPRLLCQLELTYEDGRKETVVTDDSWRVSTSAIVADGVFDGEVYDARKEQAGWDTPGFDDSAWSQAVYRTAPDGELTAHTAPTDKVTGRFAPTSLKHNADGSWEVAFPAEISGWIKLDGVKANAGDTIDINYHCDQPLGVHRYIAGKTGKQSHTPRFTWYVFSKATIKGVKDLNENNLIAEAVNTHLDITSDFSASNAMLDTINTIWRRSQLDNMHGGVASDCPHRERAPYTGDGQVAINTVMANFDAAAFYRKWMRDMRDAQNTKTGYVPNGAPWQPGCGGGVAWGAAMNVMPWEYYKHYGDLLVLQENYPAMKAQVAYMLGWLTEQGTMLAQRGNDNDPNRTPTYWLNLGDWCAPYELPSQELVHTFYLWRCLDYTAKAARALGHGDDEAFYGRKAAEVADAFHKRFYNPEAKSYGDFGSNVFALEIGVPESCRADVVNTFAKEIGETHKGHLNTGIFATRYLFEQLGANGLNDLAYGAMTKRDYPSFGHWLDQGATVTWEKWNGQDSHNHPMFGGALMWFYNTLAGVQPDEDAAGFERFTVKPVLAEGLPSVRYSTMTPRGEVASEVSHLPGEVNLTVTVPVGSVAKVMVPVPESGMKVYAGGSSTPLEGAIEQGYLTTEVGQGTWIFTAR